MGWHCSKGGKNKKRKSDYEVKIAQVPSQKLLYPISILFVEPSGTPQSMFPLVASLNPPTFPLIQALAGAVIHPENQLHIEDGLIDSNLI